MATKPKPLSVVEPNIHVLFTGICTVINKGTPTAVEIPFVQNQRRAKTSDEFIPPHEAFLVVSESYQVINASGRKEITTANGQRIIYLGFDEITVRGATGNVKSKEVDKKESSPNINDDDTDSDNLYWIPRMRRVMKAAGTEQAIPLASRVRLAGGELRAYVANDYLWNFRENKDATNYYTQAIAQIADWRFSMGGSTLVMDFQPANADRYISIYSPDGKPIVVVLGSGPNILDAVTNSSLHQHDNDPHFEIYYDRVAGNPTIRAPFKSDKPSKKMRRPDWMPEWVWPRAIVGSVNCGPDQWP